MTPTGNTIRGMLRLIEPWLRQITSANQFDQVIAGNFIDELHDVAAQLDAPVREVASADPHPEPSVRFVAVPPPFAGAAPNVVPFLPRNPE